MSRNVAALVGPTKEGWARLCREVSHQEGPAKMAGRVTARTGDAGVNMLGTFMTASIAFTVGMMAYEPLATFEFDFVFFNDFSVKKTVGFWSTPIKFVSALIFSVLTGSVFYLLAVHWHSPFIVRLPLALLLGAIAMTALLFALGVLLGMVAAIVLLLALFLGPGDR